jgi:hypothetical protein
MTPPIQGFGVATGMSKRDWMATIILAGMVTSPALKALESTRLTAEVAIQAADALIAALNQEAKAKKGMAE